MSKTQDDLTPKNIYKKMRSLVRYMAWLKKTDPKVAEWFGQKVEHSIISYPTTKN